MINLKTLQKYAILLSLVLTICCKKNEPTPTPKPDEPPAPSNINSYFNVTLGGVGKRNTLGSSFSTNSSSNGVFIGENIEDSFIDFVYIGLDGGLSFIENPYNAYDWWNVNSSKSLLNDVAVVNNLSSKAVNSFTKDIFDTMIYDDKIKDLVIVSDTTSFEVSENMAPHLVLFYNKTTNKKGAIKIKSGVAGEMGYIIADIKIQK